MTDKLPAKVRALLDTRVNTFEKLALIMTLNRVPRAVMSTAELASALELEHDEVARAAAELRADALVEVSASGELKLLPLTNDDQEAVTELVRLYHDDRLTIVMALGESALERVRTMAWQAFAEGLPQRKKP